jgi:hypothetical protein
MLSFLHDFLASKCLETEYLAMFGTGLGAVRNNTIIPWTEDVDVGITPLALQFLELNSTREELWRHGYSLWHHLCECTCWFGLLLRGMLGSCSLISHFNTIAI